MISAVMKNSTAECKVELEEFKKVWDWAFLTFHYVKWQYERCKKKIRQAWIFTYFTPTYLMVIKNNGYTDQDNSVDIGDMLCAIHEVDDRIKVIYNFANVSDEALFDSELEVIRFIKKQFPI